MGRRTKNGSEIGDPDHTAAMRAPDSDSATGNRADERAADGGTADDDEVVTWWGLVIEGYLATQQGLMDEIHERFGLAPAPFDILIRLVRSPDYRLPMTRLAQEAALSSGGFTKVADRLVAAGLIRREPCETDRRVTYAALTDAGRDLAERSRTACAQILRRRVLDPLGPTDAGHLATAMRALRAANSTDRSIKD